MLSERTTSTEHPSLADSGINIPSGEGFWEPMRSEFLYSVRNVADPLPGRSPQAKFSRQVFCLQDGVGSTTHCRLHVCWAGWQVPDMGSDAEESIPGTELVEAFFMLVPCFRHLASQTPSPLRPLETVPEEIWFCRRAMVAGQLRENSWAGPASWLLTSLKQDNKSEHMEVGLTPRSEIRDPYCNLNREHYRHPCYSHWTTILI